MAESNDRGKVKVVDRRWFTPEGELREEVPKAEARPETVGSEAPGAAPPRGDSPAAAEPPTQRETNVVPETPPHDATEPARSAGGPLQAAPGVADIVDLLAQQAMAFLSGQVPGRGRDPATARYFIDLLGVLKEKTAGRLTLEETNFLDDVLYQLRALYVAATR